MVNTSLEFNNPDHEYWPLKILKLFTVYFLDSTVTFCLLDLQISQHSPVKQIKRNFRVGK